MTWNRFSLIAYTEKKEISTHATDFPMSILFRGMGSNGVAVYLYVQGKVTKRGGRKERGKDDFIFSRK